MANIKLNDEMKEMLRKNGNNFSAKDWANLFKVHIDTVRVFCRSEGIELKPGKNFIVGEEEEYIINHKDLTPNKIAKGLKKDLGITRKAGTIKSYMKANGLRDEEDREITLADELCVTNKEDNVRTENNVIKEDNIIKEDNLKTDTDFTRVLKKYGVITDLKARLAEEIKNHVNNFEYDKISEIVEDLKILDKHLK